MFKLQQTKNNEKSRTRQKLFVLSAGVATLVASGEALVPAVRNEKTFSSGDVSAEPTDENDDIVIGGTTGEKGVVATGYGDDKIVGGAKADIIAGGAGKDDINGGAGLDILVVVGETSGGNYTAADLKDLYGTGIDVSGVIDLQTLNAQTQSDVEEGEAIDGGADNAHLYALGKVNFFGVTLANISKIFMDKEIIISDDVLQKLKSEGLTDIVGKGSIQAQIGKLDLDGVNVPPEVDILDSDGNIVVPVAAAGGLGATVELNENTTSVGSFTVTDESAVGLVTYKLEGADAALFKIDANGVIEFIAAPDFENAGDVGKDNVYDIKIVATDEHLKSVSQDVAIKVLDVQEEIIPPVFTPSEGLLVNMGENIASVATVTATDESAITYSVGGVDAQFFAIDANTGVLTFIAAPDFETPLDFGADNIYSLNVVATDVAGNVATRSVTINIQDIDDVKPVFATQGKLVLSAAENQKAVGSTSASDAAALTYSHSGGDSALFTVNATTGVIEFIAAPDFESPADAGANNVYEMTIAATDVFGNVATQAVEMTVTDVDENAPVFSNSALLVVGTLENNLGAGSVVATDESAITYSLGGVDESHFSISPTGEISFKDYPDFDAPKDDGADNIYNITAVATDAGGAFANREVKITVGEADPILTVKNDLVRKGSEFLVNTEAGGGQGLAKIATLVNGNIVATWSSSVAVDDGDAYAVKWQLFSPSGEKIGIEHLANTTVAGFQYYSNITALESGGFTIAWSEVIIDGGGITTAANVYGQVYSETGDKVGTQIQLNTSDTSFQLNPVLTSLSNGGFVAIWTTVDAAQDGAGGAVMGQMFNLLGAKVGVEFVLNQQTAGDQIAYSVTTLKNGNIVATWETTTTPQDGDGKAIKARVFDSNGQPITLLDIQVNSETVGHQINPSVAALGSGGFVVGWVTEDDNQDGSNSAIKLQLFTASHDIIAHYQAISKA